MEWKLLAYILCVETLKYGGDNPKIIAVRMPLMASLPCESWYNMAVYRIVSLKDA